MEYRANLITLATEMITQNQPIALHVTGPDGNENALTIHADHDKHGWATFVVEHWLTYQPGHPSGDAEDASEWNQMGIVAESGAIDDAIAIAVTAMIAIMRSNQPDYETRPTKKMPA